MGLGRLNPKTWARLRGTRRMLVLVLPALAPTQSACDWPSSASTTAADDLCR